MILCLSNIPLSVLLSKYNDILYAYVYGKRRNKKYVIRVPACFKGIGTYLRLLDLFFLPDLFHLRPLHKYITPVTIHFFQEEIKDGGIYFDCVYGEEKG